MSEDDLDKLREERRKQLQDGENQVDPEEQQEQQRESIKKMAAQYLTKEARSRLGNIRVAQPDLASSIEMQVYRMGQSGQVDKIDDDQLKRILRQIQDDKDQNQTDIKFRR
jgi:programmed cell death protein 5